MNGVTKESWLAVSDPKQRDGLLYDMLSGLNDTMINQINACRCRFENIEKDQTDLAIRFDRRKRVDTAAAGAGGVIGAFITFGGAVAIRLLGWLK